MKRIMISQPMNGLTPEQIKSVRDKIVSSLKDDEYLVDTFFEGQSFTEESLSTKGVTNTPVYFLSKSLELMSTCDAVIFASGWEKARGCRIEHEVALQYGLEIIEQ